MEELDQTLKTDRDFVCLPRYGCSLRRVIQRYPDGVPEAMAAEALHMSVNEYNRTVTSAIEKLQLNL